MKRFAAILIALGLVVVACGDDDSGSGSGDSGDNSELVSSLTERILADSADDEDIPFDDAAAACFAAGLIDQFGADDIVQAFDLEFDEFMGSKTFEERRGAVDLMFECVDFGSVITEGFGDAVSADSTRCLSEAFTQNDAFRDALANSFGADEFDPFDDPELAGEMLPIMLDCLSAEELLQLGSDS